MPAPQTIRSPIVSPHGLTAGNVLAALEVSIITGLSEKEADRRLKHYGPNTIGRRQRVGVLAVLIHQFQSLVVALLAVLHVTQGSNQIFGKAGRDAAGTNAPTK